MVIKSTKDHYVFDIIGTVTVCIMNITMGIAVESVALTVFLYFLYALFITRYWVAVGRTLIMSKEGCTVKLWKYERFYRWDELETKQIENYANVIGEHWRYYKGGVNFYSKTCYKPTWMSPTIYSAIFHPLRFFYVHFDYHKADATWQNIYLVDEDDFLNQMREWQVDLTKR